MKFNNDNYVLSMFSNVFNSFLKENVEVNGYKNKIFFNNLSEAQSFSVSDKLISALYKSSMEKYSMIDFGKISNSKGDFDKLERVKDLEETLEIIHEICGEKMTEVATIEKSIQILRSYKKEFCLGFISDVPLVQMIYNSLVLSIYYGMGICMTIAINFIRTPNGSIENSRNIQIETDKQYSVVIDNLNKFNKAAEKGDLKKLFNETLKKENFIGLSALGVGAATTTIAGVALVASTIAIIPIIRELIYFSYNFRMNTSEYFRNQAEFLEINVAELRAANGNSKVIKNQEKKIQKLYNIANKFEIEFGKADRKTKKDLSVRVNVDNVKNSLTTPSDDISSFGLL